VQDIAGNIAETVLDSIILDSAPPYSLSILINDGASETNSINVTLKLSAQDDVSGLDEIALSIDGKNWTDWQPFTNELSFSLPPNDGKKTLYFKVKDKAGNIANPISAKIDLTTTSTKHDEPSGKSNPDSSLSNLAVMGIILVIIIIIIVIVLLAFILKRKKAGQRQILYQKEDVVKPQLPLQQLSAPQPTSYQSLIPQQSTPHFYSPPSPGMQRPQYPPQQHYPIPQPPLQQPQLIQQIQYIQQNQPVQPFPARYQAIQQVCPTCGGPLTFNAQINRYYCHHCKK